MAQGMTNPRGHQGFRDEGGSGGGSAMTGVNVDGNTIVQGFDLYLSFGHGIDADQALPAGETFWLSPTLDADHATPDQTREWPTNAPIGFLSLLVTVNAANLEGEEGGTYIVTVNGFDTPIEIDIPAGITTDADFTQAAPFAVPAGSHVGVRFDCSGVGEGSTMRCEARLIGAVSGTATIPAALPSDPLAIGIPAGLDPTGESWADNTGNGFDLAVPVLLGAQAPTVGQDADVFKGGRYAHYGLTAGQTKAILATENEMFVGGPAPVPARTFAAVIRPANNIGGTVGCFRLLADYFSCALWRTAGNQYAYENGDASNSQLAEAIDYGGDELVCVWRTDGVLIELWINGVKRVAVTDSVGPETGAAPGFSLGNMIAHFGDRGFEGDITFWGVWARRWDSSELVGGTAYLAENYTGAE